jgi:hypothetical protein
MCRELRSGSTSEAVDCRLLWLFSFEETVNRAILRNSFIPLIDKGLLLESDWFMQNGGRQHKTNAVFDFLHDSLDSRAI